MYMSANMLCALSNNIDYQTILFYWVSKIVPYIEWQISEVVLYLNCKKMNLVKSLNPSYNDIDVKLLNVTAN